MLKVLQCELAATNATGELLPSGLKDGVFGLFFHKVCLPRAVCPRLRPPP